MLLDGRPLPPAVAQSMVGGPWITNASYHSVLVIKNNVKTTPINVRPILYIANGHSYPLQEVTIAAAGVTTLDINQALAKQGVAPWAALSGYLELQYEWPWDALCATIQNADPVHSEVFTSKFRPAVPEDEMASEHGAVHSQTVNATTVLEGLWWKQEAGVTGFVAVSNVSSHSLDIDLRVSDRAGDATPSPMMPAEPEDFLRRNRPTPRAGKISPFEHAEAAGPKIKAG